MESNKTIIKRGREHHNYKHGLTNTLAYNNERGMRRYALKLKQTPPLTEAEKKKINFYYFISQLLGSKWQVDHIVPLTKGGLHHPDNLQVVTKKYNLKKNSKENFRKPTETEYIEIKTRGDYEQLFL